VHQLVIKRFHHAGVQINKNEFVWYVWGTGEMHTGCWCGDLHVDGRIILNLTFEKWDGVAWTGLMCFGIGTGGSLL